MPLWRVFHPEGTFEAVEERQAFAKDITDVYVTGGLPAFYVVVIFIKAGKDTMFRSGELQVWRRVEHNWFVWVLTLPSEAEQQQASVCSDRF